MSARKILGEVKSYSFESFSEGKTSGQEFHFKSLDFKNNVTIGNLSSEHENAISSGFIINQEVKEQRGLAKYEHGLYEDKVNDQVSKILEQTKEKAYQEGFDKGLIAAKEEIEKKYFGEFEKKVSELKEFVEFVKKQQTDVVQLSKVEMLKIIQVITEWVLNKEVDIKYAERLIPVMLSKVQQDQKVMIKVDPQSYSNLQNANDLISKQFPNFKEIKVLADDHISHPGVVVEGESSLLNGTWEMQKKIVDDIFANLKESDNVSRTSEG